jgi:hypothetical protein
MLPHHLGPFGKIGAAQERRDDQRVGCTARGQQLAQAASVMRSSVFSQPSASRPGRR